MKQVYEYTLKRRYIGKVAEPSEMYKCDDPQAVVDYIKLTEIHTDEQENFLVFMLDTKNKIKGFYRVTRGLLDRSPVHPREVYRQAIIAGAKKIICAHNHPSGDTTPSRSDIVATENLKEAGKLLEVELVDHFIVGENLGLFAYLSMREGGFL